MNINDKIKQYQNILSTFNDNTERYRFLIDIARKAKPFPEEYRLDTFKVRGCMSQV